ncbi:nucleotidyltransferase family protein [Arenibacter aquaticus]|uniref:Nucleotidyltransferase family protein n=1 Tax=Arenibacter aquaticus TaxID=2489054 RepID=A0A3S0D368_9FLAO|nr:nucleotidyltransferase family protein [Arenibacter aquaticus]RTE52041.1 nucleotidyltransferase family protein [Arenibacter aquaticus]
MKKKDNIAILVMAAGTSSRMKGIKQLLPWGESTLLENALKNATASKAQRVLTVLGAYKKEILDSISLGKQDYVYNPNWKSGLGNSIACGTRHLLDSDKEYKGILVLLADQPLIDYHYLDSLITQFLDSRNSIVATDYGNRVGVPAIFAATHFEALLQLRSDFGAKEIIKAHGNEVLKISADGKELDIDTLEEYERVKKREQ